MHPAQASVFVPRPAPSAARWRPPRGLTAWWQQWEKWQEQTASQRRLRALQGLSDATLRDIGLADQMPPRREPFSMLDFERGLL
jgi:uncharacterized protein YjiS (DUF1127 family)